MNLKYKILIFVAVALGWLVILTTHRTWIVEPKPFVSYRIVTAYNLLSGQTDSTPCETALGKSVDVCKLAKTKQLCAANAYPLNTRLLVGKVECLVVDRTARKYADRVDLIKPTFKDAIEFGKQTLPVVVLK